MAPAAARSAVAAAQRQPPTRHRAWRPTPVARGNRFLFDYKEEMDEELQQVRRRPVRLASTMAAAGSPSSRKRASPHVPQPRPASPPATPHLTAPLPPPLQVFNLAVSRGINLFDTADSYGTGRLNGRSEQLLGRFTAEYPGSAAARGGVHIATKLAAYPWRVTPGNMVAACRGSLRRLGAERLSVGQLHWSAAKYAPLQEWALW